jgi:hypothetical protein
MDIQFLALCEEEEGIERETSVTIDGDVIEITYETLLAEFNTFCKTLGYEPATEPCPAPCPVPDPVPPEPTPT